MRRPRIQLCDINPDVVAARREVFADCEAVEISEGDILARSAHAIVSPANSLGHMDGGIDRIYSDHFGWDLGSRLREVLRRRWNGELPVGNAVIIETHDPAIPFLISAPTMRNPMDVSMTTNAYLAFKGALLAVRAHNDVVEQKIESILCPGMATACGCMDPIQSAKQMHRAYMSVNRNEIGGAA